MVPDTEYEEDLGDRPLRQGDVFLWSDRHYLRPWYSYGMIVTADCDIARNKIRGKLSYIPGFITEDYLWHFWLTGKFDSLYKSIISKINSRVNKRLSKLRDQTINISPEAVSNWIDRSGGLGIASELEITDRGQSTELINLVDQLNTIKNIISTADPDIELLKKSYAIKNNCSLEQANTAILKDFGGSLGSLPGDVFLLPKLDNGIRNGIFFMLRHITQCDFSDITIRPDEVRYGDAKAYRIGRVASPYKYAVLQNLGKVFTDIGLPDHYSERCSESINNFFELGENQ